ncbi:MAG TPA: DNA methyltransferase [Actinomycetota bacterium]|nr:DNA methyltransferase [Actinomycetota bacterium]
MNLQEIEERIATLDLSRGFDLIYDLLRAYGIPKASISRLKSGSYDRSHGDDEHLWRGKLYYRQITDGEDPHVVIDDASKDDSITRERPRFLVVRDEKRLLAVDTRTEQTLDISLEELVDHAAFFLPWAGIEKAQLETTSYADIKAAEKMARLYDEIVKHNRIVTAEDVHDLNVFFSRLLFCFFAEDTAVFPKGTFTNALASLTSDSGEDTGRFLDDLFEVLDLPEDRRAGVPSHFRVFGYVNGNLFARRSKAPRFSARARRLILDCGTLNWSQINPDIFGSMMQAVVHYGDRQSLGMHYTSVENIMKVIRPLFLDDLNEALERVFDSVPGLERLLTRISNMKMFDPACGSGNFLVLAYKELRRLENRILQRLQELAPTKSRMFTSSIKLENFFGIEIDDFAHEVAILSLWLAKHQMNVEFRELFGVEIPLIPLIDTGKIVCGNAATTDWEAVCPPRSGDAIYLLSNPPYLGARLQNVQQKADMQSLHGLSDLSKNLDYVAIWFVLGARYVAKHGASLGFVATNSICQGAQVGLLWPHIYRSGADISFGVQSFPWSNSAKSNAAVTCVIVGLKAAEAITERAIYANYYRRETRFISPYLTPTRPLIVHSTSKSISHLPPLTFGSMANDDGNLILTSAERNELLSNAPGAGIFIRRFLGATEFIQGVERFVLWITEDSAAAAYEIPQIRARIEMVEAYRRRSKRVATQRLASVPYRFGEVRHRETASIIIPRHSSENRKYIPMGFLDQNTVISDAANAIYDAELWIFGLVQSLMHMAWVKAVGGRIKSDLRYSAGLCYNTFPVPSLTDRDRELLTDGARDVLEAREIFADRTLGELYSPGSTPRPLLVAHERLDLAVDRIYRDSTFESDEERLEHLLRLYEDTTSDTKKANVEGGGDL